MASSTDERVTRYQFLGCVPYAQALALQHEIQDGLKSGRGQEHLLLLEHPPVFTLGRNATPGDIVADPEWLGRHGVEIHETDRGGQVTYHGPGQLVGYPILDLAPDRKDVRRYVADLEAVLIDTLADYGVQAVARPAPHVGVWVGDWKIASLGIHLSRWVTTHGFALNVATKIDYFEGIVACGLSDVRMTSLTELVTRSPTVPEVAERLVEHFGRRFRRRMSRGGVGLE